MRERSRDSAAREYSVERKREDRNLLDIVSRWRCPLGVGGLRAKRRRTEAGGGDGDEILIAFHELPPSNVAPASISATYGSRIKEKPSRRHYRDLPKHDFSAACSLSRRYRQA